MPLPKIKPIVWDMDNPEPITMKEVIHEPEPISPEVLDLIRFFKTYVPGSDPLKLNVCTMINDQCHLIQHCIDVIMNNKTSSRVYEAEVYLLREYYNIICN